MKLSFAINEITPRNLLPKFPGRLSQECNNGPKAKIAHAITNVTKVKVLSWTETKIELRLQILEQVLARLHIEISNHLTFEDYPDKLEDSPTLYKALWNPEHSKLEEKIIKRPKADFSPGGNMTANKYSNLNPFCIISDYYLHWLTRKKGFGMSWYKNEFEPFLIKSGVETAVVKGSCIEREASDNFWERMGYREPLTYNYDYNRDILYTLISKNLRY